jgi:hypothetical protein
MKHPGTKREYIRVLVADSNKTQSEVMCSALRRQPGIKDHLLSSGAFRLHASSSISHRWMSYSWAMDHRITII